MKIVYMGTPEFAVPALKGLIESSHEVCCVVTQPDRIKGRGKKLLPPPVKETAMEAGIEVLQPDRIKDNQDFVEKLIELNPDIIVVAAYGRILPKEILELPKYGSINIHASLLPRWRGASPVQHAILSGDQTTGVTIMQMAEGLDTGDMLSKKEVQIVSRDGYMNYPNLLDKLSRLGAELLIDTLEMIEKGEVNPVVQDDSLATYAGIIKKEDGRIDFANRNSHEIERMIAAYEPWPGAYCYIGEEQFKFKAGHIAGEEAIRLIHEDLTEESEKRVSEAKPGEILKADNTGIYIKTRDDVFVLTELHIAGKNRMDAGSFLRGHQIEAGTVFN